MLKAVRQKACLGNPPIQFTNNANESTNAKIKVKVDYKKSEVDIFTERMRELVLRQYRGIERAFTVDSGPYKVSGDYIHHKQQPNKWVKLSKCSKEMFIQEIHTLPSVPKKKSENVVTSENESAPKQGHLSVSLKESGLPVDVFQGIWSKALKLVTEEGQITMAPGLSSSQMVASESNPQKPHSDAV